MARSGRRPGGEDTRGAILEAARAGFASRGFQASTIRAIAAEAGVDPALVHHYFGSKEDLFAASVRLPFRPAEAAGIILADGIEHAGRNTARLFFTAWESPATRDALLGMLRSAFAMEQAAANLREFFTSAMLARVAPHLPGPDQELRTALAVSHLVGVAVLRYVVGFEALRGVSADDLVEQVGPRLQAYFTP